MKIEEAVEYIKAVSSIGTIPGLERIEYLLEKLGHPERRIRGIIHVAGTNGKGSFCSMLGSVLRSAGYSVGIYTSPHMLKYNERISVDGDDISDDDISRILDRIIEISGEMKQPPSEFEIITAIGYTYFAEKDPDFCIVECGMGGRWDATNVITPILSVITGVALDHTNFLGPTLEKIASEKAGIIKDGVPVIYGGENYDIVGPVIEAEAEKHSSAVIRTDRSQIRNAEYSIDGTVFDYKELTGVHISLPGHYQQYNAANVIEAVNALRAQGTTISDAALREGLDSAKWIGRFEILCTDPLFIFDGGHNEEGVRETVASVRSVFGSKKLAVISGVLRDKEYMKIVGMVSEIADRVFAITPDSYRALAGDEYAGLYRENGVPSDAYASFEEAVVSAAEYAKEKGIPVLCVGSLYTYPDVIGAIRRLENK